jgi:hypothetical protein
MSDPDWLIKARAEGRVISETGVFGAVHHSGHRDSQSMIPKQVSGSSTMVPKPLSAPAPKPSGRLALTVVISPLRLASEANAGGKLRAAIARKSAVKDAVREALPTMAFPLPAVVTLTRLGGKSLDDDNLRRAMKSVRDVVAKWLGVDDADPKVRWRYRQRPAWRMGCKIQVREKR